MRIFYVYLDVSGFVCEVTLFVQGSIRFKYIKTLG